MYLTGTRIWQRPMQSMRNSGICSILDPDERDMTKYIIGTFGALDTPLNPEAKGSRSMAAYLEHLTYEEIQKRA